MFGKNIKKIRELKGLGVNELSRMSGVNASYISAMERGEKENPTINTLKKLADTLEVTVDELMKSEPISEERLKELDEEYNCITEECAPYITNSSLKGSLKEELIVYEKVNKDMSNIINIPIVGKVAAGKPILAVENIEGYLPTLKEFLCSDNDYFYLRVKGDSMNLEFPEGSLLLIEKTPCIENGEIGVVLIDGMEATVKKIIRNKNMITLIPMSNNSQHVPQMYDIVKDQIQIVGRVKQAIKVY